MIFSIYKKAFDALLKRPIRLWGISLLCGVLSIIATAAFAILPAAVYVINLLLCASMSMIYLTFYRTRVEPKAADLFYAFKKERFGRIAGGLAWRDLWIFLWALIPIVGIVFAFIRIYEYCFTPYILLTREDVSATEAIKISKKETMGLKGKMFWADILISLMFSAAVLILGLFSQIPYVGVLFTIIYAVATILYYLLYPLFIGLVHAAFYEERDSLKAAPAAPVAPAAPEIPETPAETTLPNN